MDNLAYLIAPPLDLANIPTPTPEVKLLEEVLLLAAHHKDLSRKTQTAPPEQLADSPPAAALAANASAFPTDATPTAAPPPRRLPRGGWKSPELGDPEAADPNLSSNPSGSRPRSTRP